MGRVVHCISGGGARLWICMLLMITISFSLLLGSNAGAELSADGQTLLKLLEQNVGLLDQCPDVATWKAGGDAPCDWLRVSCTPDSAVHKLDFSSCLEGLVVVSSSSKYTLNLTTLRDLGSLQELDLSSNGALSFRERDRELFTGLTWLDISGSFYGIGDPTGPSTALPNLQYLLADYTGWTSWIWNLKGLEGLVALSLRSVEPAFSEMPEELSNLTQLASLDLSFNDFEGSVPNLEGLTRLIRLSVSSNHLSGDVPTAPNLKYLDAADNGFTNLTDSFFKICAESLIEVNLAENELEGQLPKNIGERNMLRKLDLSWNGLQGRISSGLKNVTSLDLSHNFLSGPIPPDIRTSVALEAGLWTGSRVDLSDNELNGTIPASVIYGAQYVNLSRNSLVGNIPENPWSIPVDYFGAPFDKRTLDLSNNQLDGPLPHSFFDLDLHYLWLQNNNFSGDFMDFLIQGLGTERALEIRVQGNRFTGDLTNLLDTGSHRTLESIQVLDLSHNRFIMTPAKDTQQFPNPFQNMLEIFCIYQQEEFLLPFISFTELRLAGNDLMGQQLPSTFSCRDSLGAQGRLSLQILDLASCNLTGPVPNLAIFNISMPNLAFLNVSHNRLSGTIPDGLPHTLTVLDLSSNNLVSEAGIPPNLLTGLRNLVHFNASNNKLSGTIPGTFPPTLEVLDLSHNNLTGEIPGNIFFGLTALRYIDLSGNNLSGIIPIGLPSDVFTASSFTGNPRLCGGPLPDCVTLPPPTPKGGGRINVVLLVTVVVAAVLVSTSSCLLLVCTWRVYSKKHQQDADLIATLLERETVTVMPLRELRSATSNFSESAQIGVGGFGTVYTGKLADGTTVAIKKGKREDSPEYKEQFLNEVRILSGVRHRHLVKLLGCSMENKIALLVFEFVPNGTLLEHLQGKREGFCPLTWRQRLLIALQTSDALAYLHSAADPPIFHRDVKSSNILLDDDLNAKVADFGISKLVPDKAATHVSTIAVQGTMGYIDPEYYISFQLTPKSDVYSFGVVLLELISAKPAVDFQRGYDEANLANLAFSAMDSGNWEGLIDPALADTYSSSSGKASIDSVCALAVQSLAFKSRERPDMREVRKVLQTVWLQWDPDASDVVGHDLEARHAYSDVHACPGRSSQSSQVSSSRVTPEMEMSSTFSMME